MASQQPETFTFVLVLNESDLFEFELKEANRPLYVHNYTDIIFLALLLSLAFACNVSLATTVVTHRYLRTVPFNRIVLSLSVMHILDIVFNGSVAITYMTRVLWDLGHPVCQLNAFVVQLSLFVVPSSLVHAGFLLRSNTFRSVPRIIAVVSLTWILGIFAALWLIVNDVACPYPAKMSCGLEFGYIEYATFLLAFNVVLPGVALTALCVAFILTLIHDRRTKRRLTSRAWPRWSNSLEKTSDGTSTPTPIPLRHDEVRSIYLLLALIICYVIGCVPYAVNNFSEQVFESPTIDDTRWEVCNSPNVDVFVTWFRFLVTWAHPVATLTLNEEIRQETLTIVSWWRRSSEDEPVVALHATIKPTRPKYERRIIAQNILGLTRCINTVGVTDPKTPVLFIGVDGLCLRRPHTEENEFVQFFCDVVSECCVNCTKVVPNEEMDDTESDCAVVEPISESDVRKPHRSSRHRLEHGEWPQVARYSGPRQFKVNSNNKSRSTSRNLTAIGFDDKRSSIQPVSRYIPESN